MILHFRAKSEGLGNFSLLNSETTQMSTFWWGSWESSGLLLSSGAVNIEQVHGHYYYYYYYYYYYLVLGPLSLDFILLLSSAVQWLHLMSTTCELFP